MTLVAAFCLGVLAGIAAVVAAGLALIVPREHNPIR